MNKSYADIRTVVSLVVCYRSQEGWVSVQMFVALVPQRPSAHTCKMGIFKSGEGLGIEGELKVEQRILDLSDVRG
jgi:hypothetical protein